MTNSKYLYIVFSRTNTTVGKIVRMATKHEYNHVSLSCCPKLCKMYSFARYKKNAPFVGGFVCERPSRYLYPDDDISTKICRLPITEEELISLRSRIRHFESESKKMKYNTIDALLFPLGINAKIKDSYTCLDFVCTLLGVPAKSIEELEYMLEKYVIYEGPLSEYLTYFELKGLEYFDPISLPRAICDTAMHIGTLIKRLLD